VGHEALEKVDTQSVDEIRFLGIQVAHDSDDEPVFAKKTLVSLVALARRICRIGVHQVELILLRYIFLSRVVYLLRNSVPTTIARPWKCSTTRCD
jgi:hypothetical protein